MMNWQDVVDAVAAKLRAVPRLKAEIVLPNQSATGRTKLFIALNVSETGCLSYTDQEMVHQGSVDMIASVPEASGSDEAYMVAAMISDLFSSIASKKAGFPAGPYWVEVCESQQMPPNINDSMFRINVRVKVNIVIEEGE